MNFNFNIYWMSDTGEKFVLCTCDDERKAVFILLMLNDYDYDCWYRLERVKV